jgi:hypothetical protein
MVKAWGDVVGRGTPPARNDAPGGVVFADRGWGPEMFRPPLPGLHFTDVAVVPHQHAVVPANETLGDSSSALFARRSGLFVHTPSPVRAAAASVLVMAGARTGGTVVEGGVAIDADRIRKHAPRSLREA